MRSTNPLATLLVPWNMLFKNKQFYSRNKLQLKLIVFLGFSVALAVGTPHLFDGHLFINKKYAQSLVISSYSFLSFFFSYQYLKDLGRIKKEKNYSENLLNKSYKQLGVTNRKISILKEFVSIMADESIDSRKIIMSLTEYLVHSITKSSNGIVRLIDRSNARTLTEWNILENRPEVIKISNKKILEGEETGSLDKCFQYYKSTLAYSKVECAFIFDSDCKYFILKGLVQICS
ncbi:MAG: hypothetical protein PF693_17800 [Spirochaetia bacterium]|nr:hypothetical protein [Spirochaetia bacterium]